MIKFIQINLNHCCEAQNLLQQEMISQQIEIAIISEPYRNINAPEWIGDVKGKVAVWWNPRLLSSSCVACHRGDGYVLTKIKDMIIISVYNSPKSDLEKMLEEITEHIAQIKYKNIIVAGDFNARSVLWEDRITNANGEILEMWADQMDLRLLNEGGIPTCSRPQGESIIDLTWVTPALINRIQDWKVLESTESYSDHNYITFKLTNNYFKPGDEQRKTINMFPRWSFQKMDVEKFAASIELICQNTDFSRLTLKESVKKLNNIVTEACNYSTPRQKNSTHTQTYWWNEKIAKLRTECTKKRRNLTRTKKKMRQSNKNIKEEDMKQLPTIIAARKQLRIAKNCLVTEIRRSKILAWRELIDTLNQDPWGRSYKVVLNKLKKSTPSIIETLELDQVNCILNELFPNNTDYNNRTTPIINTQEEVLQIDKPEIQNAIKGKGAGNVAPGPDGLLKCAWTKVPDILIDQMIIIFNRCLTEGYYPEAWKTAKLVLIPKPNKPGEPTKYRPICLLSEINKIFERIIVTRLNNYIANTGNILSEQQFGFRPKRSTTDALIAVRNYTETAFSENQYVVATALDIENAFNSLPWDKIILELERKRFPKYLTNIISNYLNNRVLIYIGCDKEIHYKNMTAGVPQGSILGPLLWNITYNKVLEEVENDHQKICQIICYADDTLILTKSNNVQDAITKTNYSIAKVTRTINNLGLKVAASKTKAIIFSKNKINTEVLSISINNQVVPIQKEIKYLGIMLDTTWSFKNHFLYMEKKTSGVMRLLWRLMPNIRGPGETKRRLYSNVLHSVLLYASPVWSEKLATSKSQQIPFKRLQKSIALRIIRGYKTISYEAATLLARIPPLALLATKQRRIYERIKDAAKSEELTGKKLQEIRNTCELLMRRQWYILMNNPNLAGFRVRSYILPILDEWLDRKKGELTYHLTQLVTGHGSFGVFLERIQKVRSAVCPYCRNCNDDAQHTLEICPEWNEERRTLKEQIGNELDMHTVLRKITRDFKNWEAICLFANNVLIKKEADEWERQRKRREAEYYGISENSSDQTEPTSDS